MTDFLVSQLLSGANFSLDGECIRIPNWAFTPDQWSRTFLLGLTKIASTWNGKVWEVGVGTGINIAVLRKQATKVQWYFSDYDHRCTTLATDNIRRFNRSRMGLHPLKGSWDLVSPPKGTTIRAPKVNVIFGCLPQVPSETDLSIGDRRAHYYNPGRYREAHLNSLGLGLNEALLQRAKGVLQPGGTVILNLSGRPGLRKLKVLFEEAGYRSRVVYEETIPQHVDTSLSSLAALEKEGHHDDFEFFENPSCSNRISAEVAETRRVKNQPVFHKIYVMAGTLA